MTTIPNTLQQPATLDINTKSHISLILSDRYVLLTSKKKSFWPSVHHLLLITAKNTRHIKTPNSLVFLFSNWCSSIQFELSAAEGAFQWHCNSSYCRSVHGRQFYVLCEMRIWIGRWKASVPDVGYRYFSLIKL